jgi:hypothetical protein
MKLLVKSHGGPSHGLTITGERNDMLEFASRLKAGVEEKEEDHAIRFPDAKVHGERCEWIEVQIVKELTPLAEAQKKNSKLTMLAVWSVIVFIAYLAYRGVQSF